MSVDFTYTLGGRKVSRDQFFEGLEGEIRKTASENVTREVQRVRCPKHGREARVTEVRQTRDGFRFEVSGCCDELVERAKRAIR